MEPLRSARPVLVETDGLTKCRFVGCWGTNTAISKAAPELNSNEENPMPYQGPLPHHPAGPPAHLHVLAYNLDNLQDRAAGGSGGSGSAPNARPSLNVELAKAAVGGGAKGMMRSLVDFLLKPFKDCCSSCVDDNDNDS